MLSKELQICINRLTDCTRYYNQNYKGIYKRGERQRIAFIIREMKRLNIWLEDMKIEKGMEKLKKPFIFDPDNRVSKKINDTKKAV